MTSHDAFDEAAAAYALDVLDGRERREFEAHLASCATCQQEVAALRRVTAALGAAVEPVRPPEALKARTLARAMAEPQSAPAARLQTAATATAIATHERRALGSLAWLAAAAAISLIVGLGAYAASLRSQVADLREMVGTASARAEALRLELNTLRRDSARLTNVVNVLSAPDLRRVDLRGQPGAPEAAGRAYISRGRGLVFSANHLPALPSDRVYQLWVIPTGGAPISAGVFVAGPSGTSDLAVALPAGASSLKTVAVTVEPGPGGSPGPTSPILLAGSVGD